MVLSSNSYHFTQAITRTGVCCWGMASAAENQPVTVSLCLKQEKDCQLIKMQQFVQTAKIITGCVLRQGCKLSHNTTTWSDMLEDVGHSVTLLYHISMWFCAFLIHLQHFTLNAICWRDYLWYYPPQDLPLKAANCGKMFVNTLVPFTTTQTYGLSLKE